MLRKRNLIALLMAAMLSLGSLGIAFADDGGGDRVDGNVPGAASFIEREAAH